MFDLPLFITSFLYLVLGFALGLGVYFIIKHPRFRFLLIVWFPIAVVGIACINFSVYAINAYYRTIPVTAEQNLLDNAAIFIAALFGMAFSHWLLWEDYKHLLSDTTVTTESKSTSVIDYDTVVNDAVEKLSGYIANNIYKDNISTNGKEQRLPKREVAQGK